MPQLGHSSSDKKDNPTPKNIFETDEIVDHVDAFNCNPDALNSSDFYGSVQQVCAPDYYNRCANHIEPPIQASDELQDKFERLGGDPIALKQALCFLNRNKDERFIAKNASGYSRGMRITNQRYITINHLTKGSDELRLFVIDLEESEVKAYKSAHGQGKGSTINSRRVLRHTSNENNSKLTPRGFFLTGNKYTPGPTKSWKKGMRLHGLQKGVNDNNYKRGVVMHASSYVSDHSLSAAALAGQSLAEMSDQEKKSLLGSGYARVSGRTAGCTGVGSEDIFDEIFEKIGAGVEGSYSSDLKDEDGNPVRTYQGNHSLYYNYSAVEREQGGPYCGDDPKAPLLKMNQ